MAANIDLEEVQTFLIKLAREAGSTIASAVPKASGEGFKKNSADLVTETDQAVEKMISTRLTQAYPHFGFMGEETYKAGDELSEAPTFIVDPIDGTTNFFHGHPYVAVSIGVAVARKPVVGVIYNPFTQTLFTAVKGRGATMTGFDGQSRSLPLREPEPFRGLSSCLVAVEWGSDRTGNDYEVKTKTFSKLCATEETGGAMVHGIRSLGSAELNICGVAAGHLDVYWEAGCWAWDVCAGWVILEEAGGRMVGANPGDWDPKIDQRRYMAARAVPKGDEQGQKKLIEDFWGCVQGKVEVGYDTVS